MSRQIITIENGNEDLTHELFSENNNKIVGGFPNWIASDEADEIKINHIEYDGKTNHLLVKLINYCPRLDILEIHAFNSNNSQNYSSSFKLKECVVNCIQVRLLLYDNKDFKPKVCEKTIHIHQVKKGNILVGG